jgi:hypothetical protein
VVVERLDRSAVYGQFLAVEAGVLQKIFFDFFLFFFMLQSLNPYLSRYLGSFFILKKFLPDPLTLFVA